MTWVLSTMIKVALVLAASWIGTLLLRRSAAAARHQMWTLGVVGALLLPVLCWFVPSLPLPSLGTSIGGPALHGSAVLVTGGGGASAASVWPLWLAIAWAAGTLLVAIRFVRGHVAARRLSRTAAPVHHEPALREAAVALGIPQHVDLRRSTAIASPMTIGVLHPRVLLPVAADAWSHERRRAVLMHELGHVRRHDTLIQLAAQLACALYWWNPLAWLAAARMRSEREHACDDLVLGAGILPSSYAADLLEVARSIARDDHAFTPGAVCMADLSGTEARLRRILDPAARRHPVGARFRRATRFAALAGVVALACTSTPPPSSPSAPRGTLTLGAATIDPPTGQDAFRAPTFRPPTVEAQLTLSVVEGEVNRRLADLTQCYERRLRVDPTLAGTILVHWNITAAGTVPEQCITSDTVGDPEIADCVNKLVAAEFPPPRGGSVHVAFPFVFAPARD